MKELLKLIDNWFWEEWNQYLGQMEYTFPAKRTNGKFYNLEGKEIFAPRYKKFAEFETLLPQEQAFVIWDYHRRTKQLNSIKEFIE